ncbi:hypothetical protein Bpfe_030356 [Biomphalaria pfeifferi]|uniref:Tetraspanin n=1 Tax=Biomphalaria pfeifferi TaxID=112525 RepID=A0AAD8EVE7_BIOPF|nr:hypothetical protein Bpfe_030356 [Biomphalaria pfeifferi]
MDQQRVLLVLEVTVTDQQTITCLRRHCWCCATTRVGQALLHTVTMNVKSDVTFVISSALRLTLVIYLALLQSLRRQALRTIPIQNGATFKTIDRCIADKSNTDNREFSEGPSQNLLKTESRKTMLCRSSPSLVRTNALFKILICTQNEDQRVETKLRQLKMTSDDNTMFGYHWPQTYVAHIAKSAGRVHIRKRCHKGGTGDGVPKSLCNAQFDWTTQNRNNNADDDDDDDDEEEEDEETLLMKNLERKILIWHSFVLVLSTLLMIVGFVLLYGFSPYVRYIITTFPGYNNYGHFVNLAYEPKELRFGEMTSTLGVILVVLNVGYILCQLIYLSSLVHRNPFALPLVTLLTGVVLLIEVNMINIYMSPVAALNADATNVLQDKLLKSYAIYDTNMFSVTYDIIAIWGRCCGIINQYDFQTMLLKYRHGGVPRVLQVPATCCKETEFISGISAVVDCAVRAENIYTVGCYNMLFDWLMFYCNLYSIVVVIQLLDMAVHILLYKRRVRILILYTSKFKTPIFDSWLSKGNTT